MSVPSKQESLQRLNDQLLMAKQENNQALVKIILKVIERLKMDEKSKQ